MHRIAENEDSLNGIRSDVRSAHIGIILPDDPFDCVSHSEFLAAVFLSDSSRSRSLSTATTSYPWPANARAFLPNPHGASKIGSLYDEATRSRNCIKDLDGMSEVGSLALDTGPISPNDYRKDPRSMRRCPSPLRMLLVLSRPHSLCGRVSFTHVCTIFGGSVTMSTSEMIDF